jgi:hypothetical protein
MHSMTWALAGRMTVWVVLAVLAYALLVYGVARLLAWVSSFYPVSLPHDPMKYEGRDLTEAQLRAVAAWQNEEEVGFALDEPEQPRRSA